MFHIGPYHIANQVVLAPMAGVTDLPFRQLCRNWGAGMAVSEMVTSDSRLWNSRKSTSRMDHRGETVPRVVQIAGSDPQMMATAAQQSVARGAQIIDINMGCPAKKVCKQAAGSALLRDEPLVRRILEAVTAAAGVPVTLKIRTGWNREQRNAVNVARMAEDIGVAALSIHGRSRACGFGGSAEYDTIAEVVECIGIPVLANGDIDSAEKAAQVLQYSGARAVMIGRAAQGQPWIFRKIQHFLDNGEHLPDPSVEIIGQQLCSHLRELHKFYGEFMGVRIARKHLGWYLRTLPSGHEFRNQFNRITDAREQCDRVEEYFEQFKGQEDIAA